MKFFSIVICVFLLEACTLGPTLQKSDQGETVLFEYFDNRIMVPIMINGQGPFHMVFDTGGSNMLLPEAVARLNLKTEPAGLGGGAGDKKIPMQITENASYTVGHMEMKDQKFMVMDLSHIKKAFGFKNLDGIIGYELLQRYAVTINYDNKSLFFQSFENFKPEGEKIGFRIYGNKPVISSEVQGVPTEFLVDTGDRSSFTLFKIFAKSNNFGHHFAKKSVISGYGVGGPIPARLGVVPEISLGKNQIKLSKVSSRLPLTTTGFFAQSKLGGSLGNGVLQDFIVSFNYKTKEMFLAAGLKNNGAYRFVPPKKL